MTSEDKISAFEKSRLEYCEKLYEREVARKNTLEKKSQFSFSFITILLGTIFLSSDFLLEQVLQVVSKAPIPGLFTHIAALSLLTCLLVSLFAVWQSMRIRSYTSAYPDDLIVALFASDSEYIADQDSNVLMRSCAMNYAAAALLNADQNARKGKWVTISLFGALASVILSVAILAVYISVLS